MFQQDFHADQDENDAADNLGLAAEKVAGAAADFNAGEADDKGDHRDNQA